MAPDPLQALQDITAKKKIYFIRHGESMGNKGPIRQAGSASLTEQGRKQAQEMANRCEKLPIDLIISSSMMRASETASIIAKKIDKKVETSDLFVERRRPSVQLGKLKDDPESVAADKAVFENFSKHRYRHSDEENFDDLKVRAFGALDYLAKRKEEHIAVVTHGFFMRVIVASVIFGKEMKGKECERVVQTFHMENTGLTVLGYDGKDATPPWWLWVWNDHAHLG